VGAFGLSWLAGWPRDAAPATRPLPSSPALALGNEPCDLAGEPYLPARAACGYVAINDFDGDGSNDRFYTYVVRGRAFARLRLAAGGVTPPLGLASGLRTRLLRAADLDSDGRAEALVTTGSGPITLELSRGALTESVDVESRVNDPPGG
jgi:hypothetical protein